VHGVKTETYESASPEVKSLVRALNKLASATTLEEHTQALQPFDEDMTFDTPFIQIQGRERVRVLATLAKMFLGTFEIEPRMVKISVPEGGAVKGGKLEIDGIVHWRPHRPWYLPLTFLLPRDIPIFADVSMGIKAHNDKIYFVSGKTHNMPHVPRLLRVLAGYVAGLAVSITEPTVNNLMEWYRSGVETATHATSNIKETAYSATTTAREYAARGIETAKETVSNVAETAAEKMPGVTEAVKTGDVSKAIPTGTPANTRPMVA